MNTHSRSYKVCRGCGNSKALTMFHRRTRSKDGHDSRCMECINESHKYRRREPKSTQGDAVRNSGLCVALFPKWMFSSTPRREDAVQSDGPIESAERPTVAEWIGT